MALNQHYLDFVLERLELALEQPASVGITSKKMFGGAGIYFEELFFAIVSSNNAFFLYADQNLVQRHFDIEMRQLHSMPYYEVPEDLLENTDKLADWAAESLAAARLKPKKKATVKKPKKKPKKKTTVKK